jgi:hypothetical protein
MRTHDKPVGTLNSAFALRLCSAKWRMMMNEVSYDQSPEFMGFILNCTDDENLDCLPIDDLLAKFEDLTIDDL